MSNLESQIDALSTMLRNFAVAGALCAARINGILFSDGYQQWRPGCGRQHPAHNEVDRETAEQIGPHEMVGEYDCMRCGEGMQHYLHTDRDTSEERP